MALEATHIRFALDVKGLYKVSDMDAYLSGCVYPDSRFVTGVDKYVVHPRKYWTDTTFLADDFRKGWLTHLLIDDVQWDIFGERFSDSAQQDTDSWIKRTAIKNLQDISDAHAIQIAHYMPRLTNTTAPFGEDSGKIHQYHQILRRAYTAQSEIGIETECDIWRGFGIGEEKTARIRAQMLEYKSDSVMMTAIQGLYNEILMRAQSDTRLLKIVEER